MKRLRDWWWWLLKPSPYMPPVPRDENMKGLGWRGDRREVRPFEQPRADGGADIHTRHEDIRG